jgi:multiple sugar transport system substrate-binding protein
MAFVRRFGGSGWRFQGAAEGVRARVMPLALVAAVAAGAACDGSRSASEGVRITLSGSAVGAEADVLRAQLDRFMAANPDVRVEIHSTPDAADQRHQLYVQWLNARTPEPDVLQLDVIWTAEFAAAGWILPLDRFGPDVQGFFPATVSANRWGDGIYALPWFVDAALLYWRTDLVDSPPETYAALEAQALAAKERTGVPHGFVWQGARYEGLVTVFLEQLHASGGEILDAGGEVRLESEAAVRALTFMREAVQRTGLTPEAALTWQEEQVRFAFQNGEAVFMRNWPYAYPLLSDSAESAVAGRFAVAPLPAGPGGGRASALGGQQLAVSAHSREPEAAWRLVEFLTSPEEMLARARGAGHYPARTALYELPELADALPVPPAQARAAIESAVPRPAIPVYTELSSTLQVWLHRALTGQAEPREALASAAAQIRTLLERLGTSGGTSGRSPLGTSGESSIPASSRPAAPAGGP